MSEREDKTGGDERRPRAGASLRHKPTLQHHESILTRPGAAGPVDAHDNPMSPNFVPVGEATMWDSHRGEWVDPDTQFPVRSEVGRARWWALRAGRQHPKAGVFDE